MNQKKIQVWLPVLLSVSLIIGMFFGYKLKDNMGVYGPSFFGKQRKTTLQEILELVKTKYVDTVNVDSLGFMAIQNVLSQLDPHSVYIPAEQVKLVNEDLQGNFEGVGIEFEVIDDTVTVLSTVPNGPAETAGIKVGDRVLTANDSLVSGVKSNEDRIRKLFRGPRGTEVNVQFVRNGQKKTITIQRGIIPVKSVDAAYMIEPGIAFIRINKFSSTTYEEFMQNLERLKGEGMKMLILDLRQNGGGIMDDAIQIADEFLDGLKEIVYTEGKSSPRQDYTARRPGMFEEGKLVVLIDEGTASASEVLTGALQDWDRATIIGRRSFGKGLVQEQFNLSDGSAIRLTISRYFTPIGRSIQKPYQPGSLTKYKDEVIERFTTGEVFDGDSARHNGKAFKTKGGRIVYGGGGINPDVFVPVDSTEFKKDKRDMHAYEMIAHAAFYYYLSNQSKLQQIKSPAELSNWMQNDQSMWSFLQNRSVKDSFNLSTISPQQKIQLQREMIAMVGRQLWRKEGFFKVMNLTDPMILKALEFIKK